MIATMSSLHLIRTPGLGDTSYVFAHEGAAVVVDPQRDIDRLLEPIAAEGLDVRYILETHLHNDYVSGGRDLARETGAELVLPASAAPAYRHTPAFHLEDLGDKGLTIRPIHTPGHTPEHTSYAVLVDGELVGVFTGGSLLVGSAGRPDLLGPERKDTLARLQYRSVTRLAELPDATPVYPTHGEGSFCTAGGCGRITSTIALEKAENPLLSAPDEDAFVEALTSGLGPWPTYYRHMGPANLYGPAPMDALELRVLGVAELRDPATTVVDIREKEAFAAGHIPGSVGLELRDDTGVWAGWVLDHDASIVLIADPGQDADEALRQLRRIGMDAAGVVWGLDAWTAAGLPLASYRTVDRLGFLDAVADGRTVLDVRMPNEWADGTIPGSRLVFAADVVADGVPDDLSGEVWVACGTGFRATAITKWLEEAGLEPVVLTEDGVPEVLEALGATTRS
jgi:glyoxylase-like metal-dependent hydrolase (beta-lactamase superfamily II)